MRFIDWLLRKGKTERSYKEIIVDDTCDDYRVKYEEQLRAENTYLRQLLRDIGDGRKDILSPPIEPKSIEDYKNVATGGFKPFGTLKAELERKLRTDHLDRMKKENNAKS